MVFHFFRHLNDVQDYKVPFRDNPILNTDTASANTMAKIIKTLVNNSDIKIINFIHSSKIRTYQTVNLVNDELQRLLSKKIVINIFSDDRLDDMYHGNYNVNNLNDENNLPVTMSNKIFLKETFEEENIFYQRGDPVFDSSSNIPKYPYLVGKFYNYGESQIDSSIRLYSFLIDQVNCGRKKESLSIIFAHTLMIIRVYEISKILETVTTSRFKPGRLIFEEWKQPIKETLRVISKPPYYLPIIINPITCSKMITEELDLLSKIKATKSRYKS